MDGEAGPLVVPRSERSDGSVISLCTMLRPRLESCRNGDPGVDPGLRGDLGEAGLKVDAVRGCAPSPPDFAALRLSAGGPLVLGMLHDV